MLRTLQGEAIAEFIEKKRRHSPIQQQLQREVEDIITAVLKKGFKAVAEFSWRFDGYRLQKETLFVEQEELEKAQQAVEKEFKKALEILIQRITAFHEEQKPPSPYTRWREGELLGNIINPIERVGVYIPGGRNPYPSTLLMTIIPARVAGVLDIIVATPPQTNGQLDPYLLYTAKRLGVKRVLRLGGAQAIAAMAYGLEEMKPVHKIVGPGNIYVTLAKKILYGTVGIDMLAGPSEIVIIADASAPPLYIGFDLMAQAEHDPLAVPILITPHRELIEQVNQVLEEQVAKQSRRTIIKESLEKQGRAFLVKDLHAGLTYANSFAPEHLVLMLENPEQYLPQVKQAGAIFLGSQTPQASGDYLAGPSHVIPTGGTCRFSSPLGVEDFQKKSSLISFTGKKRQEMIALGALLAEIEGLTAHQFSLEVRREEDQNGDHL